MINYLSLIWFSFSFPKHYNDSTLYATGREKYEDSLSKYQSENGNKSNTLNFLLSQSVSWESTSIAILPWKEKVDVLSRKLFVGFSMISTNMRKTAFQKLLYCNEQLSRKQR